MVFLTGYCNILKLNFMVIKTIILVMLLLSGIIFISCARKGVPVPKRTLNETIVVERDKAGAYTLTFDREGIWKIYKGNTPDSINWNEMEIEVKGKQIVLNNLDSNRIFFGIENDKKERTIVSERKIYLDKIPNFRDLGGIPTMDGRIVSWGKIYRSSRLTEFKPKDLQYFNSLGIEAVADFRYDSEIKKDPDDLPPNVKYYKFPIGGSESPEYTKLKKEVLGGNLKGAKAKTRFGQVMEQFADSAARDFKPVMDLLVDGSETPLVYHCSGGKDRTGFMSSVILAALNVDEETIKNEYMMSNYYRYKANKKVVRLGQFAGVDQETMGYAIVVQKEYIDRVFNLIKEKYGTIDNYLEVQFGLTPALRLRMKELYTDPPLTLEMPDEEEEISEE